MKGYALWTAIAEEAGECRMKVRAKDIARRLGVSPATVSNALNGRKGVGEEMSQRILDAAEEMGYFAEKRGNIAASYIRLVIYKRHGMVVMDTQFFMELIEAIERACRKNALEFVITYIHAEKDKNLLERIHTICNEECAGILLLATEMLDEDLAHFDHCKSPIIALDNSFPHKDICSVAIANFEAGYRAAKHLIAMGHTHIGHITSAVRFHNSDERMEGFFAALRESGLVAAQEDIIAVTPTLEGANRDMKEHLQQRAGALPTAFFSFNDIAATGSMQALYELYPDRADDISMIGMDDTNLCQFTARQMTTIRVYRGELGRLAVRHLLDLWQRGGGPCAIKSTVGIALIERESVADLRG